MVITIAAKRKQSEREREVGERMRKITGEGDEREVVIRNEYCR